MNRITERQSIHQTHMVSHHTTDKSPSKHNIVRLEIARRNRSDESFHQVASTQSEWLKSEILVKDKKPALYVTEEEFNYRGAVSYTHLRAHET